MIPNITRGPDMAGLMGYLVGPGKTNEHTDPHLVTGDPAIMAWWDDAQLNHIVALDIAKQLDQPRRVYGTEVKVPNYLRDEHGDIRKDADGKNMVNPDHPLRDGNVWHCSLSLKAEEGVLSDEKWGQIAEEFMDRMGFTTAGGRSPARWVAVRHGLSKDGNDHIHLAASTVREDGTKVDTWNDYDRSQKLCGELERKYGLQVLESRGKQPGVPGVKPAEVQTAARRGDPEPARETLRRIVRECAVASKTEAEFVRRLRANDVWPYARFAAGRGDVVTGYSVALKPKYVNGKREPVVRYSAGEELASDLSLPSLRREWESTPENAAEAVAEWTAAKRGKPVVYPDGRETRHIDATIERAAQDIAAWNQYLRSIPEGDRAQWARAAGRTAGVLAAWSRRVEARPGPLAHAAKTVERCAQVYAHERWQRPVDASPVATNGVGGAVLILCQTSRTPKAAGYLLLLRQISKTLEAIRDAQTAFGEFQRAAQLDRVITTQLAAVRAGLPTGPEPITTADTAVATMDPEVAAARDLLAAQSGQSATEATRRREPGSPIPNKLEPRRSDEPAAAPDRDREVER